MNTSEKNTLITVLAVGGAAFMIYAVTRSLRRQVRSCPFSTGKPALKTESPENQHHKYTNKDDGLTKYGNEFVEYIYANGLRTPPIQEELLRATKERFPAEFVMAGGKQVGAMLNNLIRISHAKKGIEVGVFTGFTTLGMALALPEDGKIYALDVSDKFTSLGQEYWAKGKVDKKIDLRIAPAEASLDELLADAGNIGTFDFAFIDADKVSYDSYYEKILILLKKGGWILFDNMFSFGNIVKTDVPERYKESLEFTKKINQKLHSDDRVEISLLEVCDGVTLVVKK